MGSTPTCSHPPLSLAGVTEMHPGNYAYYDVMQKDIGACCQEDIAVRVATRVVGHQPRRNTLLVDLGWTGVSQQGADNNYGAFLNAPELKLSKLKQEIGYVACVEYG